MTSFDDGKRRLFFLVAASGFILIIIDIILISGTDLSGRLRRVHIPHIPGTKPLSDAEKIPTSDDSGSNLPSWFEDAGKLGNGPSIDKHPIEILTKEADTRWTTYEDDRTVTFRQTVAQYRRKYGRHPPPGFKEWYKYARERNVHNINDFEQVMDDLRPFWAVEPKAMRLLAAYMSENEGDGVAGVHIRNHTVAKLTNQSWRSETMATLIERFIQYIPDMDIAMNRLDQPRLVIPWEDMQQLLKKEEMTRQTPPDASDSWTNHMTGMLDVNAAAGEGDKQREDPGWFPAAGKQYMDLAKLACPPDSHARNATGTFSAAEGLYKSHLGGLITNFNRSTDLCTIGPEIQEKHGFLYSASSISASNRLVPVFGECKVSVNSDILFPANMYWLHDDRYDYDDEFDYDWAKKEDVMIWRGVSSGGIQLEDNWQRMHRQRLVQLTNHTVLQGKEVRILSEVVEKKGEYENFRQFQASRFAENHTDVGFVETWGCIPNCDFYAYVFSLKNQTTLSEQFKYKYVVDVDGHSFSGRWRAFLQSKSLGIKATIFREWHDSRLFAWRHFIPMDNRFDDLYTILTYFIGYGIRGDRTPDDDYVNGDAYVPRHDAVAQKIARQGREWAAKVLRAEDIEIYMYRLLIEYARLIDDNRDHIGYAGDGSELDHYDSELGFR